MFDPIFPGMDPFIEDQRPWQEFHNALTCDIRLELTRLLVPPYRIVGRSYVELGIYPDEYEFTLIDQLRIEVRDENGRLVTVVEVLSPANKSRHRDRYLANRDAILSSNTHLVEIDLLLNGQRTEPDFPKEGYVIMVARSRADKPHHGDVYEFVLQDALPVIPVPLTNGDPDVPLNLPELLKNLYVAARYRFELDYSREISAVLSPATRAWVEAQLKAL